MKREDGVDVLNREMRKIRDNRLRTVPAAPENGLATPEEHVQMRISPREAALVLAALAIALTCASLTVDLIKSYGIVRVP